MGLFLAFHNFLNVFFYLKNIKKFFNPHLNVKTCLYIGSKFCKYIVVGSLGGGVLIDGR
jgi:hypothetical protein